MTAQVFILGSEFTVARLPVPLAMLWQDAAVEKEVEQLVIASPSK